MKTDSTKTKLNINKNIKFQERDIFDSIIIKLSALLLSFLIIFLFLRSQLVNYFIYYTLLITLILLFVILLLSIKTNYLKIFDDSINFPISFLNVLRKERSFHCNEIKHISIDNINKSLIVTLNSGKLYNYNDTPFLKTERLFPIVKDAFIKFKHIEYIHVPKEDIIWHRNMFIIKIIKFSIISGYLLLSFGGVLLYYGFKLEGFIIFSFSIIFLIIILFVALLNNNLPYYYLFSKQNLYFKYRKNLDTYPWTNISTIEIIMMPFSKKLGIKLKDGTIKMISLLSKKDKQKIIDYSQKIKKQIV